MTCLEDEFGDIIQKARSGLGLSVQAVSGATGIEPSVLAGFEGYRGVPSEDQIASIAGVLGLDSRKLAAIADGSWLPSPDPWLVDPSVVVHVVPVPIGGYSENCYVLGCSQSGRALIVDPGGSAEAVARAVRDAGLCADSIAITHGHSDHTGGVAALLERLDVDRLIGHPSDLPAAGLRGVRFLPVEDGSSFEVGALTIKTLHTQGHTPGSVCYLSGLVCFVGDTLFAGSLGRAAGPEAYQSLLSSVRGKLLSLPKNTALLPGHGPATTVEEELLHNPFF